MVEAQQEYSSLIHRCTSMNKYTVKALQVVAETNDQYAQEIVQAINIELSGITNENKEALHSLLQFLGQHPAYSFIKGKEPQKRAESEMAEPEKKRKIQKIENSSKISVAQEPKISQKEPKISQKKPEIFYPYPPEYFLFKLVDRPAYTASYIYYTEGRTSKQNEQEVLPDLTRDYLVTAHLDQAIKLLYTSAIQCKVCGMRFDSLSVYTAHAEIHQKKTHITRNSSDISMWQSWLLEPTQWTQTEQKVSVNLKSTIQEKVSTVPVRGDRDQKCTICGDGFEIIWSDENECWSFNDALVVRTMPREISHKRCVS
ncbi:hypothetical protein NEPAR06_2168 [Nematocida parisii]|uniref:C2H2-type domain-containing protein n=1 Tax=Nematocida parisii (strain ERTm3) TaxID=935791 RepID=I3EJP6_NEMP3|nr:hypothetical protein NEQG_00213 [Nematocida parisii ERTm3]KAI5156361.1 hypothetical protein NEPAR06_2168 [Nematocida parisii]